MLGLPVILFAIILPSCLCNEGVGPVGKINIKKVELCPDSPAGFTWEFTKDDKNRKAVDASADFKRDFNENWEFKMAAHKKINDKEMQKNAMKASGKICDYLEKNMPTMRDIVYENAGVEGKCKFPKGKIGVKKCHATEANLDITNVPYGSYQIEVKVFDDEKTYVGCFLFDVDSTKK